MADHTTPKTLRLNDPRSTSRNSKSASKSKTTSKIPNSTSKLKPTIAAGMPKLTQRSTNACTSRPIERKGSLHQAGKDPITGRIRAGAREARSPHIIAPGQAANIVTEGTPPSRYAQWLATQRLSQLNSLRVTGTGDHRRGMVTFPRCGVPPEREASTRPAGSRNSNRGNQPEPQVSERPVQDEGVHGEREGQSRQGRGGQHSETSQSEGGNQSPEKIINNFIIRSSSFADDQRSGERATTPKNYKCSNDCKKLSGNFVTNYQADFSCNSCCSKTRKGQREGNKNPKGQPPPMDASKLKDNQHLPCMRRDLNYSCYDLSIIKHINTCHSQWRNSEWLKSDYQANFSCPHCLYHSSKDSSKANVVRSEPEPGARRRRIAARGNAVQFARQPPSARRAQAGCVGVNVSNNRKVSGREQFRKEIASEVVESPCKEQELTKWLNPVVAPSGTTIQVKPSPAPQVQKQHGKKPGAIARIYGFKGGGK